MVSNTETLAYIKAMILKPLIGIDNIKFGMAELKVKSLLGSPDKIITDPDDEDKNIVYQYNNMFLRLTFYTKENNTLGYIRTSNPKAKINNQKIIGETPEKVIHNINSKNEEWVKNSYFSFNSYFNEAIWTELHEEFGIITNIELGNI